MPSDIAIGTANFPTSGAPKLTKPAYLIVMTDLEYSAKSVTKVESYFIALDRPSSDNSFISVKGLHVKDYTEEEIIKGFTDIVTSAPKESVVEMMFPTHRVKSIRSLVFNAVKPIVITR